MTFKSVSACGRRRLCGDRGRLRSRHRDGEVLQHQVQGIRTHATSCRPGKLIKARLDYTSLIFMDRFLLKKSSGSQPFKLIFNLTKPQEVISAHHCTSSFKLSIRNKTCRNFFNLPVTTLLDG